MFIIRRPWGGGTVQNNPRAATVYIYIYRQVYDAQNFMTVALPLLATSAYATYGTSFEARARLVS